MRRRHQDESGQAVVFFIGILILIFGFMAFAIDIGFLFHARRVGQNAADAAALAGAQELEGCGDKTPLPVDVANNFALKNLAGKTFSAGDDTVSSVERTFNVTDNSNGTSVPFPSVYSYVERPQSFLFARFFGLVSSPVPAEAEAVCAPASGGAVCPFSVVAPDLNDLPAPGKDTAYGIKLGKVYVIKGSARESENGNFLILDLFGSGTSTTNGYTNFVARGCDVSATGADIEVIVDEEDILINTLPGNKGGPTRQAFDDCRASANPKGLFCPEHDSSLFPANHATCDVPFVTDPAGPDGILGTADDGLSGTVTIGGVPMTGAAVESYIDTKMLATNCDGIDANGDEIPVLMHPGVQGRFIQIVLLNGLPNGGSDPAQVMGILRMYVACWDHQDLGAAECVSPTPPGGQTAIYGIFAEYQTPNFLKTVGTSTNVLAPKHVVLVK